MKTSELIRKLAYEIQMHGDLELSFEVIDKDFFKKDICGNCDVGVFYGNNNTTRISIWQYDE